MKQEAPTLKYYHSIIHHYFLCTPFITCVDLYYYLTAAAHKPFAVSLGPYVSPFPLGVAVEPEGGGTVEGRRHCR